jgi:hypothetical protein
LRALTDFERLLANVLALRPQGLDVLRRKSHMGEGIICNVPAGKGNGSAQVLEVEFKAFPVYIAKAADGIGYIPERKIWASGNPDRVNLDLRTFKYVLGSGIDVDLTADTCRLDTHF